MTNTNELGNSKHKELARWNIGAFALTFFWTLFNGYWVLALLSLIPVVGTIIGLVLMVKGNRLAWERNTKRDYASFVRYQHRWNIAGILFLLIISFPLVYKAQVAYDIHFGQRHEQIDAMLNNSAELARVLGKDVHIYTNAMIIFESQKHNLLSELMVLRGQKRPDYYRYFTYAKGTEKEGMVVLTVKGDEILFLSVKLNGETTEQILIDKISQDPALKALDSKVGHGSLP